MLLWAQDPNGLIKLIQAACTVETKPPFKDQTKTGPLGWIRVLNLTAMLTDTQMRIVHNTQTHRQWWQMQQRAFLYVFKLTIILVLFTGSK